MYVLDYIAGGSYLRVIDGDTRHQDYRSYNSQHVLTAPDSLS